MTSPAPLSPASAPVPGTLRPSIGLSLALLIAVNLLPLVGVLAFGWSVLEIMLLFWAENIVIGLVNILRMTVRTLTGEWGGLFLIPFFTVHYGMFCAGHGLFLLAFFGREEIARIDGGLSPLGVFGTAWSIAQNHPGFAWSLAGLTASHLVSFLVNFLISKEYRRTDLKTLMGAPYGRIMILHVTIIFGGIGVQALGAPVAALALLVVLKTTVDGWAHWRERRRFAVAPDHEPAASTA